MAGSDGFMEGKPSSRLMGGAFFPLALEDGRAIGNLMKLNTCGKGAWNSLRLMLFCIWAAGAGAADETANDLAKADTGFSLRLARELAQSKPSENLFISPCSVSAVLQMVGNGARGQTQSEMARALGFEGTSWDAVNRFSRLQSQSLAEAQSNVVLTVANAIWYRQGTRLIADFERVNREGYGAVLEALDFGSPQAPIRINRWVEESTRGRIQNMVAGPLSSDMRVILANAVYFKGAWLRKFDTKETQPLAFHPGEGPEQTVPMMRQRGDFAYFADGRMQAVRLPYQGGRLAMIVLLPATNSSPDQLLSQLDAGSWLSLVQELKNRPGLLRIPRFKLEYEAELNGALSALGMRRAFTHDADFSGMSAEPLFLSEVKHKAFVEVNEQGTEAAAATIAVMRATSFRNPEAPFEMTVDRPFLFALADESTRTILFLGLVRRI
jgi:serpin B